MKAIAANRYGAPAEVLSLVDLPDPKLGPDSVLVRAKAAGVNPVDWKILAGYLDGAMRVHFPLIPGWDLAGVVEKVGGAITEYAPGDEVVGYVREDHVQWGTFAELVAAPVRTLAKKPERLSFEEASGLPLAGLTAYQTLAAVGLRAGDTVLVHAASGGVGSFAVQIAKARGARVIGTASEASHAHVRSLGGEPVAYAREVRHDEAEAREIGIQGVPFFVLGGRYAVSGAQPADALAGALERAFGDGELHAPSP